MEAARIEYGMTLIFEELIRSDVAETLASGQSLDELLQGCNAMLDSVADEAVRRDLSAFLSKIKPSFAKRHAAIHGVWDIGQAPDVSVLFKRWGKNRAVTWPPGALVDLARELRELYGELGVLFTRLRESPRLPLGL